MDRYLLSRTGDLVRGVRASFRAAIADAAEQIQDHLDMLTNWYVRRSRDRFWEGDAQAIDVLATCLETLCRSPRRCCRWSPRRSGRSSSAAAPCT